MCKLSGAYLQKHRELVWTVRPVVALPIVDMNSLKDVLAHLNVELEPSGDIVLENIKNITRTPFSKSGLFHNYTAVQRKGDQTSLMKVMSENFKYLQQKWKQNGFDVSDLREMPCIPVNAIGQFTALVGQFPVLGKPHCAVFSDATTMKHYYPFLHSVPDDIYHAKQLLKAVGVEESLQIQHMRTVLHLAFEVSATMELDPTTFEIVKYALKKLSSMLKENNEDKTMKMGENAIAEDRKSVV